jgi:hypothetical protein
MFDACLVLPCENLFDQRQLSGENEYFCPEPIWGKNTGGTDSLPCSRWNEVWWTTKYQGWPASAQRVVPGRPPYKLNYTCLKAVHQIIARIYNAIQYF